MPGVSIRYPSADMTSFTAAPHRVLFFFGALQLVLVLAVWSVVLISQTGILYGLPAFSVAPIIAHALLLYYGLFPFFMFGFVMTTFPRWMNGPQVARSIYVTTALAMGGGWLLVYSGLVTGIWLVETGLAAVAAGWLVAWLGLLRVFRAAEASDKSYETILLVAFAAGGIALIAIILFLSTARFGLIQYALNAALWLWLIPVALTVAHRMLPFFSNIVLPDYEVYRPRRVLFAALSCLFAHFVFDIVYPPATWIFDLTLAALALQLSLRWQWRRALTVRLLGMLHIAFLWLALGAVLFGIQGAARHVFGIELLGRAPLHALGVGFLASLMLAFASRVTLGHSGRGLAADRLTWGCFLALQVAAAFRVLADFPYPGTAWSRTLVVTAALIWVAGSAAWTARYAPMYWRARSDGRPG